MNKRKLGNTDEPLSAIGLGCMGMSHAYGSYDDGESLATLHRALELGITFWDTADMYGNGRNEELLAQVLKHHRKEIFLATKFGFRYQPDGSTLFDGSPAYLKQACEASLRRLGVEVIDLYYAHRADDKVPIEEMVGAMAALVQQGKVRYLGLSEVSADTLRKAHHTYPISALQSEYSLFTREVEAEILPACRELGIGFVPFSPLGRGMLAGNIPAPEAMNQDDFRKNLPRFQSDNWSLNARLVGKLTELAGQKGCTPAQLALAWVLTQGEDIIPIPGTKRRTYLQENAEAVSLVLTEKDRREIQHILDQNPIAGQRYGDEALRLVNR